MQHTSAHSPTFGGGIVVTILIASRLMITSIV